jgi:hypothetical protein
MVAMEPDRARDQPEEERVSRGAAVDREPVRWSARRGALGLSPRQVLRLQPVLGNASVTTLVARWPRVLARVPAYRRGGKTATNLTPRDPQDIPGGLSCTDTPGKGWTFPGGRASIEGAGFEVQDDPITGVDEGHFLVRPGPTQGFTVAQWAAARKGTDEKDPQTWHQLTTLLRSLAT